MYRAEVTGGPEVIVFEGTCDSMVCSNTRSDVWDGSIAEWAGEEGVTYLVYVFERQNTIYTGPAHLAIQAWNATGPIETATGENVTSL